MARWKEPVSQGRREDVIDRVHWLWSLEHCPIDLDPGPSYQFYPERWESDNDVPVMPWEVQAMHLHLINVAFNSRPVGSLPDEDEMRIQCKDPSDEEWNRIRRTLLRAWEERHGRMWQPGTCRAYLAAIVSRFRRARSAAASHEKRAKKDGDAAQVARSVAMQEQCKLIEDALHHGKDAMQVASGAMLPLPSPSPSPSPGGSNEPPIEEAATAADNGKPKRKSRVSNLSYPAELLRIVPDFQERWLESRKMRQLGRKTTPSAEQKQIDLLAKTAKDHGAECVLEALETANRGSYQGIFPKAPQRKGYEKPNAGMGRLGAEDQAEAERMGF